MQEYNTLTAREELTEIFKRKGRRTEQQIHVCSVSVSRGKMRNALMSIKTKRRGFSACVRKGQDEDEPLIRRTRCFGFQQEKVT